MNRGSHPYLTEIPLNLNHRPPIRPEHGWPQAKTPVNSRGSGIASYRLFAIEAVSAAPHGTTKRRLRADKLEGFPGFLAMSSPSSEWRGSGNPVSKPFAPKSNLLCGGTGRNRVRLDGVAAFLSPRRSGGMRPAPGREPLRSGLPCGDGGIGRRASLRC